MATMRLTTVDLSPMEQQQVEAALGARYEWVDADDPEADVVISGGSPDDLEAIGHRFPQRARVWVCDAEEGLHILGRGQVAHEVLVRPMQFEAIADTVAQARETHDLLVDPELSRLIDDLGALPSLPSTYQALCRVLVSETASMSDVAEVVSRDMAVSSRILSVVNSALYSLPRTVSSLQQAATMLGISGLRDLVLAIEVFGELSKGPQLPGVNLEELQNRSHARGTLARMLAPKAMADLGYTTGLLFELGRMVLAAKAPDRYIAACYLTQTDMSLAAAEVEVFGVSQRELGARLLALWGLPWDVVRAVLGSTKHTEPGGRNIADLVQLADLFVEEAAYERGTGEPLVLVTRKMMAPWGLAHKADLARSLARTLAHGLVEPPVDDERRAS